MRDAGMKFCFLDIRLAAQWRGANHNSCIAFTLHAFADIQHRRGDILLVEPVVKIEVSGKQAVGDSSEVDAVVNGAFEGQSVCALTKHQYAHNDALLQDHFAVVTPLGSPNHPSLALPLYPP